MQVFAQKSVLVVSIYFPLIALICTDIPCFCVNPCVSVVDIASLPLLNTKKKAVSRRLFFHGISLFDFLRYKKD